MRLELALIYVNKDIQIKKCLIFAGAEHTGESPYSVIDRLAR
jgi:hypothetical protein